jgi:hypothetical protein
LALLVLITRQKSISIGFNNFPASILQSKILTGNKIAEIAGLEKLPQKDILVEEYINLQKYNFG